MLNNKNLFLLIAVVVVVVVGIIAAVIWLPKKPAEQKGIIGQPVIGEQIDLVRVGMFGEKTDFGFVKVPLLEESENLKFLNVAVDLNNDQKFSAYQVAGETQPEWLIQNMPVRFIDTKNSFSFFFPDKTVDENVPIDGLLLKAVLSQNSIADADWDGRIPQKASSREIKIVSIVFEDVGDLQSPAEGKDGSFGFFYSESSVNFPDEVFAQEADPVNVFHPDVPDIDQGTNECAPTSAANSLLWLAKKFDFEDKLPSQADLIKELKEGMNWEDGIFSGDFLPGKEKITKDRKLPLTNKKIGNSDGSGTFDAMAEELKKGEDVEMRIQYKDADGNNKGGHWVTIVGLERMSNGTRIIDVHDPLSPGPSKLQRYRLDDTDNGTQIANYPYGRAYVSFAVSESYFEPPATPVTVPLETPGVAPEIPEGPVTTPPEEPLIDEPAPEPEPETSSISISPTGEINFEHQIGSSPCPQLISTVQITKTGTGPTTDWTSPTSLPNWLDVPTSGSVPENINLNFTCVLATYTTQTVSTSVNFQLVDEAGNPVGEKQTLTVTGSIIAEEESSPY